MLSSKFDERKAADCEDYLQKPLEASDATRSHFEVIRNSRSQNDRGNFLECFWCQGPAVV